MHPVHVNPTPYCVEYPVSFQKGLRMAAEGPKSIFDSAFPIVDISQFAAETMVG